MHLRKHISETFLRTSPVAVARLSFSGVAKCYSSGFVKYCVSVWSPHYTKDKEWFERVQHRFTRIINEARNKDCLDRLKKLTLWTPKNKWNKADLVELFKMYKGYINIHFECLFTLDCNSKGTRGHSDKLSKPRCQKDVRKYFLHRVINR